MANPFTFPGEFPDCGCHYTSDDDGIHFCRMHRAAPELLAACQLLLDNSDPYGQPGDGLMKAHEVGRAAIAKAKG